MIKVLVIADDFTGALDTGVQFRAKHSVVRVAKGDAASLFAGDSGIQVLIVDAETRHLAPQAAYQRVAAIVREAVSAGVACIYKKTDSGLRGNIGAELAAMLDASGEKRLHFIPAFPKMGRTTVGGVHYIDGVPVAQSMFGRDPFEPVRASSVAEIIAGQSRTQTYPAGACVPKTLPDGILIYDSATDEQMRGIASELKDRRELRLLAGCAGFAAMLPTLLELEPNSGGMPPLAPKLLTVCGSINPVTVAQLDAAETAGLLRLRLTPRQKLDPAWLDSREGHACVERWFAQVRAAPNAIIDCSGVDDGEETCRVAAELGLTLETMRRRIAQTMGSLLQRLIDRGLDSTLLVTGGDTLLAFMERIRQDTLIPICELTGGVVLSQIEYRGQAYGLLSKSGGFGEETLLTDLEQALGIQRESVPYKAAQA